MVGVIGLKCETIFSRFSSGWKPKHTFSETGSPIVDDFIAETSRFGDVKLTKVGTSNLYDRIQSYAESCDMALLISRYMQGDATALNRVQALYGDFSEVPKTLPEAISLYDRVSADFSTLPAEVKQKFDNNVGDFISSFGSPDFFDKMKVSTLTSVSDSSGEVIDNE